MKKLITICLMVCIRLFFVSGCSPPSGEGQLVENLPLTLTQTAGFPPMLLDVVVTDFDEQTGEANNVYTLAHGYECKLEIYDTPLPGVKVFFDVIAHYSPSLKDGWQDIYERIGFNLSLMKDSRTDKYGICKWIVGIGNKNLVLDPDAPRGEGLPKEEYPKIASVLELSARVKKIQGNITADGYCDIFAYFNNGVGWGGDSYLGKINSSSSVLHNSFNKENVSNFLTNLTLQNMLLDYNTNSIRKSPQDYNLLNNGWCQLRQNDANNFEWQPAFGLVALWIEPNEPNASVELMSSCSPYAYVYDYNQTYIEEANAITHTVVLKSFDVNDSIISKMLIKMHIQSIQQDTARLISDYIVPMEFAEDRGIYYDLWGNKYVCPQILRGGHLEISPLSDEEYGDFNLDGRKSNIFDFSLFSRHWKKTPFDFDYDFMYDHNIDGIIDWKDLLKFSENYLGE